MVGASKIWQNQATLSFGVCIRGNRSTLIFIFVRRRRPERKERRRKENSAHETGRSHDQVHKSRKPFGKTLSFVIGIFSGKVLRKGDWKLAKERQKNRIPKGRFSLKKWSHVSLSESPCSFSWLCNDFKSWWDVRYQKFLFKAIPLVPRLWPVDWFQRKPPRTFGSFIFRVSFRVSSFFYCVDSLGRWMKAFTASKKESPNAIGCLINRARPGPAPVRYLWEYLFCLFISFSSRTVSDESAHAIGCSSTRPAKCAASLARYLFSSIFTSIFPSIF